MSSTTGNSETLGGDIRLTGFCSAGQDCTECRDSCRLLREASLRPTRQRVALADILFAKGDRHISAELLYDEARAAGVSVSLATVYNTLHQFSQAGLLRSISVDSSRTYFDTNTGNHNHFFVEETNEVIDMPEDNILTLSDLPEPPEGMEIASVDIVVRVRRRR